MFQSVEKHEATQAIICTILSASNTSLWRLLLKGFYRGAGGRGETWQKKVKWEKIWSGEDRKRLFCMVFDAFFLEDYGTPAGVPFLQWQCVCLCAWGLWVPATGCLCWLYGADGACIVELRVNGMEGLMLYRGGFFGGGYLLSHWEWMQAEKGFVCAVWVYWLWREVGGLFSGVNLRKSTPFLPGGGTTASSSKVGGVLFSAAIKCAMYYVACLKTYTL